MTTFVTNQSTYSFRYRRLSSYFFTKISRCIGHEHNPKTDIMTVFLKDGGIRTIKKWKECELLLKSDFGAFMKQQATKEAQNSGVKL